MARPKKQEGELTVKVADAISNGEGGYLTVGEKFSAPDPEAAESLKAKGLAE